VFTHVTACMFAKFLTELSTPEASAVSLPPRLLQLLPAGAKVAGRGSHPLEDSALARRTRSPIHRAIPRTGNRDVARQTRSLRTVARRRGGGVAEAVRRGGVAAWRRGDRLPRRIRRRNIAR
jgi:Ni/Co efflux regulator RcnB